MKLYLKKAKQMIANFQGIDFGQVSRAKNFRADILAKWATTSNAKMPKSFQSKLKLCQVSSMNLM